MNKERLVDLLSVPTFSTREELMRNYLINYAEENDVDYHVDEKGNIYFVKGEINEGENYPCVVSHIDTVHRNQLNLIDNNIRLTIVEPFDDFLIAIDPTNVKQTGIGGDDKCGVAICLGIFERIDVIKAAFFVEEEIGMLGSREADWDYLNDCGYFIQFDAPGDNWVSKKCMSVNLFDEPFFELIEPILTSHGQTKISSDPFTDVLALREMGEVNCLNLFAGYHNMHTSYEYVKPSQVFKAIDLGSEIITELGPIRSLYVAPPPINLKDYFNGRFNS